MRQILDYYGAIILEKRDISTFTASYGTAKTRHVLIDKAHVLEPVDLGSILFGGFLEGHDFTTRHGRFRGRPP